MGANLPDVASLFPDFPGMEKRIKTQEVYRLEHDKLPFILLTLGRKDFGYFLREKGIDVIGLLKKDGALSSQSYGMILSGGALGRGQNSNLYLVTFENNDADYRDWIRDSPDLVELLRRYIV